MEKKQYSKGAEFCTVSVPNRTVPQRFFLFLSRLDAWNDAFPQRNAYHFPFFCKSARLTAATFSVFIFSEICTVKTLKYVSFFCRKKREAYRNQYKTVFRYYSWARTVLWNFCYRFSFFYSKNGNLPFFGAKKANTKAFFTVLFALLNFCMDRGTVR